MAKRVQVGARVDRKVYDAFKGFVREHRGQVRGELGDMLEDAMLEYMDRDRLARVESRLDDVLARLDDMDSTRTHKASEAVEKTERIAAELESFGRTVIPNDDVIRAIESIAGADDRTIRKYQRQLKRHGFAYEHPTGEDPAWTVEREQWVKWAENHIDNDPMAEVLDLVEPYPMDFDDYDRLATEVAEA